MAEFHNFVLAELGSLSNEASIRDEDVFNRMREAFKKQNREEFGTPEEADIYTADALAPYSDVATLEEFNSRLNTKTPVSEIVPPTAPDAVPQEDAGTALGFSVDNAQKLFGATVATIGDLVHLDAISEFGEAYIAKQEREIVENNYQSTYNKGGLETLAEDGAGAFIGWLGESILENFATSGLALAGAGAAALTAPVSAPLAAVIGKATLVGTASLGIGEVRQELEDKGVYSKDDALFATGAGIVVGLLDKFGAGKQIPKNAVIKGMAEQGIIKDLGKAAATEFGTEAAQEATVIGAAYMDGGEYETSEVLNRVIDAGIIGGAMGAGTKGTVRALSGIVPNAENLNEGPSPDIQVGDIGDALGAAPGDTDGATDGTVFNQQEIAADAATFFNEDALADTTPDPKSRTRIVYMNIADFLSLAEPLDSPKESFEEINAELEAGGKVNNIPFLKIENDEGKLVVFGHEGRNRALAIQAQGGTAIPVEITHATSRFEEGADALPSTIVSQDGSQTFEFNLSPEDVTKSADEIGFVIGGTVEAPAKVDSLDLEVTEKPAGETFNDESDIVTYTDKESKGKIELRVRPDGSASVLELLVPEEARGQGIGQLLQERAQTDYPTLGGQVSSKAAATTAYRLGRRPVGNPDATLEEVYAAIDEDSSVNLVINPELAADQEQAAPATDAAADQDILGDILADFDNASPEVIEDVIQSDVETVPNTAGVVTSDEGVVNPEIVDALRVTAAGLVEQNKATPKIDHESIRTQDAEIADLDAGKPLDKGTSFDTWAEYFPDAKTYGEMRVAAVKAVREEIVAILEASGITVDVSSAATNKADLQASIGSGSVSVDAVDKIRGGILSVRVPGQQYTYAEALGAIQETYGKGASGVERNEAGDKHASSVTESLFSAKARTFVSPFLATGTDRSYILPRVELTTKQQSFFKDRKQLTDAFIQEANPNEQPVPEAPSLGAIAREAGHVPDQVAYGDKARRILDRGAEAIDKLTASSPGLTGTRVHRNKTYKKFADAVQFSIFASQDNRLSKLLRNAAGEKQADRDETYVAFREFKRLAKEYDKGLKDGDRRLNEIYHNILTGKEQVVLRDDKLPADADNILTDGNGNAYLRSADGVGHDRIALPILAPLSTFVTARQGEQKILIDAVNEKIKYDLDDLNTVENTIDRLLEDARAVIAEEGGFNEMTFKAFGDTKTGVEWVASLQDLEENHLGLVLNSAINHIARTQYDQRASKDALQATRDDLHKIFIEAAVKSSSLEEFISNSKGLFLEEDGSLNVEIGLALGVNEGHTALTRVGQEIAKAGRISQRIDDQIEFNKGIASNGNYVANVYAAYLGNDPTWVQGMDVPTSDAEIKARRDYEESIVEEMREEAEAKDLLEGFDEDAARKTAQRRVQEQVESIKESNKYMAGGGQDQHLLFSALNAVRKRNKLTPEFEAFIGKITDPNILMEETLNRMRENKFARSINTFIHDNFVGDGVFENEAAVDRYNAEHPNSQIDFNDLEPFIVKDKDNISKSVQMWAHPTIAQSQKQFASVEASENPVVNVLQRYGAEFRLLHTVASLPTGMLNLIAGTTTMLMGGGNPLRVTEGSIEHTMFTQLVDVIVHGKAATDPDFVEALRAMAGSNAKAGQIQRDKAISQGSLDSLIALTGYVPIPGAKAGSKAARKGWRAYIATGEALYKFGDLLPKLVAYKNIKNQMSETYSEILTEEEIVDLATRHARDMSFDMAQVPEIVRTVREKFLLGGAFLSYDSLLFATVTKNFRNIAELRKLDRVKWGVDNIPDFNPATDMEKVDELMPRGAAATSYGGKRFGYMTASLGAPILFNGVVTAGAVGLASMFAGEDDNEPLLRDELGRYPNRSTAIDNMRQLMPDYYKNSTITPVRVSSTGAIEWMDTGRMTNHGKFMEGYNAMFHSDPNSSAYDIASGTLAAMFGGYITPGFGFKAAAEVLVNESQWGQQIYNEDENIVSNAIDIAEYALNDLGSTATIGRLVKTGSAILTDSDSLNYNPYSGEATSPIKIALENIGVRVKTFDPVKELQSRVASESYKLRNDKTLFRSQLKTYNNVPDSHINSSLVKLRTAYADSMANIRDKIDAARALGISEDDITLSIKGSVTAKESKALRQGLIPQLDLGRMGQRNTKSSSIKRIESEAKTNFGSNFERATIFNNGLPLIGQ